MFTRCIVFLDVEFFHRRVPSGHDIGGKLQDYRALLLQDSKALVVASAGKHTTQNFSQSHWAVRYPRYFSWGLHVITTRNFHRPAAAIYSLSRIAGVDSI